MGGGGGGWGGFKVNGPLINDFFAASLSEGKESFSRAFDLFITTASLFLAQMGESICFHIFSAGTCKQAVYNQSELIVPSFKGHTIPLCLYIDGDDNS